MKEENEVDKNSGDGSHKEGKIFKGCIACVMTSNLREHKISKRKKRMKKVRPNKIAIAGFMIGVITACSLSKNENYNSRGYYKKEAFGQFPNAPGSNKSPKIDILMGPGKRAPQFATKKSAKIRSGLNLNCEVKANSILTAIGDA